mmetsp:Transcript_5231/g.16457  ORF Transcript_5231/g.16457 Transcript_5231/m.16457 type:complete len:231 (+) Transcript_5231:706-1398(+)
MMLLDYSYLVVSPLCELKIVVLRGLAELGDGPVERGAEGTRGGEGHVPRDADAVPEVPQARGRGLGVADDAQRVREPLREGVDVAAVGGRGEAVVGEALCDDEESRADVGEDGVFGGRFGVGVREFGAVRSREGPAAHAGAGGARGEVDDGVQVLEEAVRGLQRRGLEFRVPPRLQRDFQRFRPTKVPVAAGQSSLVRGAAAIVEDPGTVLRRNVFYVSVVIAPRRPVRR